MVVKLKASVGKNILTGKTGKNFPDDVNLIRQMLRANKFNVRPEGGFDAGMGKAIFDFQKKARLPIQDGIIDPGAATFKALLPRYQQALDAVKNAKWYKVKLNNKEVQIPEQDLIAVRDQLFRAIQPSLNKILSRHNEAMELYKHHVNVAQQKEGLVDSIMQWVSMSISKVQYPSGQTVVMADGCIADLKNAVKKKDLDKTQAALIAAEPAVNKFNKEMRVFHEGITEGSAKSIKALEFTRDTSFEIFEALATASLIKVAGSNADNIAATGTAFLKSTANQYGRYLAGKEASFYDVGIDTGGALVASFGGKAIGKYIDQKRLIGITGEKFAQYIRSSALPISITNRQGVKFIENHARGALKGAIKGAIDTSLKEAVKIAKRGRVPNFDELMDHGADVISGAMAGMVMGAFTKQRLKFAHKLKKYLGEYTILNSAKNLKRGKVFIAMSETNKKKVLDKAMEKLGTEGLKWLANEVLEDPGKDNTNQAAKNALKDKEVTMAFEKALDEAIGKFSK